MDNLWTRRSTNSNKLSLSTAGASGQGDSPFGRNNASSFSPFSKRLGGDSSPHGKTNPFGSIIGPSGGLPSPTAGASAFALGSGAFAAFGAPSVKTPKSPANPFEASLGSTKTTSLATAAEPHVKDDAMNGTNGSSDKGGGPKNGPGGQAAPAAAKLATTLVGGAVGAMNPPLAGMADAHRLRDSWVFWIRPPISKANGYIAYEKTLYPIATCETVEHFFAIYAHLKRPSDLPMVSDYHLFKKGVRPIWEDEENKKGGKWIVRLKKGLIDRYWEDLLLAIIGDQFSEAGEEICGVVLSVRNGEDIISIWVRAESPRNLRIRDIMKQVLSFPQSTLVVWKSHDASIQQRTAIEESRREKANNSHHNNDHKRPSNKQ